MAAGGRKPEWTPEGSEQPFASSIRTGVEGGHDGLASPRPRPATPPGPKRKPLTREAYIKGVLEGDRVVLARAITLVESNAPAHAEVAQHVLTAILPYTGKSIRIGITGVPGAGKSTFIETLGVYLSAAGHRIAVLAVDPSSSVSKGSVLGDKTRMESLSRDPRCFIRPSPTGGTLGGVARKTRETMLLCEAAGFDTLIVETVGVGQSEVTVRSMVDFFLLLLITGAGDELQGLKKGVVELADAVLINKSDGENRLRAEALRIDYARALHFLPPATQGWTTRVATCSALTGEGIPDVWEMITQFRAATQDSGVFEKRRKTQLLDWVHGMVEERLRVTFLKHARVRELLPSIEQDVLQGKKTATVAVHELLQAFDQRHHGTHE